VDFEQLVWLFAQETEEENDNFKMGYDMHKKPHFMTTSTPAHDDLTD
jgi:hypothetical protein